jgi:hypothetical protein
MKTIELYTDEILEAASLGQKSSDFAESRGDYVRVLVYDIAGNFINVFESSRILFEDETGGHYLGDYHFHNIHGFMAGKNHTDEVHPTLMVKMNEAGLYKKQFNIYVDKSGELYLKPSEFLKLDSSISGGGYVLKIHFLRNIKTDMSNIFGMLKNNLIENGNFFAGLEATQTGDLDTSIGRNRFRNIDNPGFGKYVLEQDGYAENNYTMKVTGIKPNTGYVFSCWVAWDDEFDAGHCISNFDMNFIDFISGDCGGTKLQNGSRDVDSIEIDGLKWHRRFLNFFVPSNPEFNGFINLKVGLNDGETYYRSTHSNGRRYFTDLRLEELKGGVGIDEYLTSIMGTGYPVPPTPDNNDINQRSGSMGGSY